ncbi:hypothetical protein B296_00019124 [Ensete ventricosum]|uniref:DNA polymerase delta/zeta catalytic subunit N-terminal domain-containing protein n=1 Tax=Ensete ventricosum TaxID=4639 RepID=A0A427B314_ENSVE|nr:hypothetical protein B296_00019124 [Ensete ventricosum]
MASPPAVTLFSVRIVSLDYYMAPPIPDLDICYSSFHGWWPPYPNPSSYFLNLALPYLYIPCPVELLQGSEEGDEYIKTLITAIEKALEVCLDRTVPAAARQHVHGCSLGYFSVILESVKLQIQNKNEISFEPVCNVRFIGLDDGTVLGRTFQPYESHIPFLLHFLVRHCAYPFVVS